MPKPGRRDRDCYSVVVKGLEEEATIKTTDARVESLSNGPDDRPTAGPVQQPLQQPEVRVRRPVPPVLGARPEMAAAAEVARVSL